MKLYVDRHRYYMVPWHSPWSTASPLKNGICEHIVTWSILTLSTINEFLFDLRQSVYVGPNCVCWSDRRMHW